LYLFLRDAKLLLRDSIYKLYINTVYLFLRDAIRGIPLVYKLYIYKVYLLLRDAKLLMSDSIYKLYINTVYLLLRDTKLLLRDANVLLRDSVLAILRCMLPYALIIEQFLIFKEQRSLK